MTQHVNDVIADPDHSHNPGISVPLLYRTEHPIIAGLRFQFKCRHCVKIYKLTGIVTFSISIDKD